MSQRKKIPVCQPVTSERDVELVSKAIREGWISGISPYVETFEEKFSRYCGTKYGVATNSGTTALHLALATAGVKEGDEVIIPTFTMIATPNAVAYLGAKPVLVDADSYTWNIDTNKIEAAITPKTKAIIPVHTYGHPVDMAPVREIAMKHNLFVLEDAAEAHGAEYKGKKTGGLGHAAAFSFYANKVITTGEGGMITTNDEEFAERAKWLRAHAFGREGKHFYHERLGYGYRFSGLQAAFGLAQLERIDEFIENRRRNARLYNELLSSYARDRYDAPITLPPEADYAKSIYWMYSILVHTGNRSKLIERLDKDGIETRTFFYPVHQQPIYKTEGSFDDADRLARQGMNLPSANNLTEEEIFYICQKIKENINIV